MTTNARLALMTMAEDLARQLREALTSLHCPESAATVLGIELGIKAERHDVVTRELARMRARSGTVLS